MSESEKLRRPAGLGARGRALWDAIADAYQMRPDEVVILEQAAHEADIIERLHVEQKDRPLITTGSMGQEVAAPHVMELRLHRACLASLLKQLKLPDESGTRMTRSEINRNNINTRWRPTTTG